MKMYKFMSAEYFVSILARPHPHKSAPAPPTQPLDWITCRVQNLVCAYNSATPTEQLLFQHCHYCQHQHYDQHRPLGPVSSWDATITIISSWSSAANFIASTEQSQLIHTVSSNRPSYTATTRKIPDLLSSWFCCL